MNTLISFYKKQQGLISDFTYDFALCRLCVAKEDNWKGITPSYYSVDYNPEPPLFAAKFANCKNYQHILALASEDGKLALQDINKKNYDLNVKALEGQQCHYNAIFDIAWDPGQMQLVSASGDHTARLWSVTESELKLCRTFKGHTRSVKTATFRKFDSAVFATGGRDGTILVWDTRAFCGTYLNPKVDNCILKGHQKHYSTPTSGKKRQTFSYNSITSSITGLVFQDDYNLISCGAGDGIIKVWDMRRNYTTYKKEPLPKHTFTHTGLSTFKGFTNLLVDESGTKLYVNCMDNIIYCYSLTSYSTEPLKRYVGTRNNTFYIKSCLSPDGNYLISGSSDSKAYIWNVKKSLPLVTLNGHKVEVTCVAWTGIADTSIVTCSDDARHKIWRIGPEKIDDDEKLSYKGFANLFEKSKYEIDYQRTILEEIPKRMQGKRLFDDIDPEDENDSSDNAINKKKNVLISSLKLYDDDGLNFLNETSNVEDTVHNNYNNQENSPKYFMKLNSAKRSCNSCIHSSRMIPLLKLEQGNSSETTHSTVSMLSKLEQQSTLSTATTYSPTLNLPNYVLNGEAPHLQIMSPKQDNKNNIDWLTRIRKRKLLNRVNVKKKLYHCNDKKTVLQSTNEPSRSSSTLCNLKTYYCENNLNNLDSGQNIKQILSTPESCNTDYNQIEQKKHTSSSSGLQTK